MSSHTRTRAWLGAALFALLAACGDDASGDPCTTSSECTAGESCIEGRCRRTSVRDLGSIDLDDARTEDDASMPDARIADAGESMDAMLPRDAGDPLDARFDSGIRTDARIDDAAQPDAPRDAGRVEDAVAPDAPSTDAGPTRCGTSADCPDGELCAVARCGDDGVCTSTSSCADGAGSVVCACDGTENHTFPSCREAESARFGGVLHEGACVGVERFGCAVGPGPSADCKEHEWCEPSDSATDACSGRGLCEARPSCGVTPGASSPVCGCDGWSYPNDCEAQRAGVSFVADRLCTCSSEIECASGYCNRGVAMTCGGDAAGVCERVPTDCAGDPAQATCACPGGRAFSGDCERRRSAVDLAQICSCSASGSTGGCCGADTDCVGPGPQQHCYGRASCTGAAGRCLEGHASPVGMSCWDDRDCITPGTSCVGAVIPPCDDGTMPVEGTCSYRQTLFRP